MQFMDRVEFAERNAALLRAKKIYIPGVTKSLNLAFALYQTVLAERERELFLSSMHMSRGIPERVLHAYEFKNCPECGVKLKLRTIGCDPGSAANLRGWQTHWYCINGDCIYEKYSQRTVPQWMNHLKRRGSKENGDRRLRGIQSGGERVHQARSGCGGS